MLAQEVRETRPPASESKRLDIQGLRAVAVILVVAFHAGLPVSGGFIGVDVFLVISGFVITAMLKRELDATGTIRFRTFYTRRIKRLLPALAVITTIVVGISFFIGSSFGSQQTTARTGLGATYISANIVIYNNSTQYFAPSAATNPLLHTWTLSVEEQVYLVFPALLLGSWLVGKKLKSSRRGAIIMLAVAGGASWIVCTLASYNLLGAGFLKSPTLFAFYSSVTRLWEFAIGAGLAFAATRLAKLSKRVALPLGIAGGIAILYGAVTLSGLTPYPGFAVLLPVLGAAAVIAAGSASTAGVSRPLSAKPMVWIGDLSYSWYLWHWPLIVFGLIIWPTAPWIALVLAIMSLVPSWLSKKLLEDRIRFNKGIVGWKAVILAIICTLVPTLACLGLAAGARTSWGSEAVAQMQQQVRGKHVATKRHCDDAETNGSSLGEPECEFNTLARGPHLYLVGNSVAAQYSEALISASRAIGSPLTIDTTHGCFVGGAADAIGREGERACSNTFTTTVEQLVQQDPGVVVMSSTWDLGALGGELETVDGPTLTPEEARERMVSSLTDAVTQLRDAGHHVVIVLPTPKFFYGETPQSFLPAPTTATTREGAHETSWRPSDCWNIVALKDVSKCGATLSENAVAQSQDLTFNALKEVAATTGATALDLRHYFCADGTCRTNVNDVWMFQDGIHITPVESEGLGPAFVQVIRQVVAEAHDEQPTWLVTSHWRSSTVTLQALLNGAFRDARLPTAATGLTVIEAPDRDIFELPPAPSTGGTPATQLPPPTQAPPEVPTPAS